MAAIINVSESNRVITEQHLKQLINNKNTPVYKWFSLQDNVLDGTYHPIDSSGIEEMGWWGNTLSDSDGVLSSAPVLSIIEPRVLSTLQIVGDSLLNEYPVDFNINIYNEDILLHTETVIGNTQIFWKKYLPGTYDVTKIEITITKVNKAGRTVKITDAYCPMELVRQDSLYIGTATGVHNTRSIDGELLVALNEKKQITNVHTKMDANYRQTFAKVEITYSDPFLDDTIEISSSGEAYNTFLMQVADNIETPAYKWFNLHNNKLDGTFHPVSGNHEYSTGWWSNILSNEEGIFEEEKPTLIVEFAKRALYSLKVVGDAKLDCYPIDFTILAYSGDTLIDTFNITDNNQVKWAIPIEIIMDVTKLVLVINQINRPHSTAKIMEFFTAVVETYYNDEIMDISILEEFDYSSSGISLGNISSNEIDITLYNKKDRFNLDNEQSPLYNQLKRNRRISAWLGTEIVPGVVEWYPLGKFWSTKWNIPDNSLVAYVNARDRLELLRQSDFISSEVYINHSLYQLFEVILNDAGLTNGVEYIIDETLSDLTIPYAWFDRMKHREALQRLASCAMIHVSCNRKGQIVIGYTQPTKGVMYHFNDSTNIFSKDYPQATEEITNFVEVVTSPRVIKEMQEIFNSDEEIDISANGEIELTYVFSRYPNINVQLPTITADGDVDIVSTKNYAWGTVIVLANNTMTDIKITNVSIQGQPIEVTGKLISTAKDEQLIRDNGEIKTTVEHDFIQSTAYANYLATTLLNAYKNSRYDIVLNARGNIGLYLGHRVQVDDNKQDTHHQYLVRRQHINWSGSLDAIVECKKI